MTKRKKPDNVAVNANTTRPGQPRTDRDVPPRVTKRTKRGGKVHIIDGARVVVRSDGIRRPVTLCSRWVHPKTKTAVPSEATCLVCLRIHRARGAA